MTYNVFGGTLNLAQLNSTEVLLVIFGVTSQVCFYNHFCCCFVVNCKSVSWHTRAMSSADICWVWFVQEWLCLLELRCHFIGPSCSRKASTCWL